MKRSPDNDGRTGVSPVAADVSSADSRLQKLESTIAHLERQYDELNKVVIEQSRAITRLQSELGRATEALRSAEIERIRANNPKPPHYQ
jgi:uncharacterized coiled-coil protein SlyX